MGSDLSVTAPPSCWVRDGCIRLRALSSGLWTLVGRGAQGAKEVAELKMFLSFIFASSLLSLKKLC